MFFIDKKRAHMFISKRYLKYREPNKAPVLPGFHMRNSSLVIENHLTFRFL